MSQVLMTVGQKLQVTTGSQALRLAKGDTVTVTACEVTQTQIGSRLVVDLSDAWGRPRRLYCAVDGNADHARLGDQPALPGAIVSVRRCVA